MKSKKENANKNSFKNKKRKELKNNIIKNIFFSFIYTALILLVLTIWILPTIIIGNNSLINHKKTVDYLKNFIILTDMNHKEGPMLSNIVSLFIFKIYLSKIKEFNLSVIFIEFTFAIIFMFSIIKIINFVGIKKNQYNTYLISLIISLALSTPLSYLFTMSNIFFIPISLMIIAVLLLIETNKKHHNIGLLLLVILSLFDIVTLIICLLSIIFFVKPFKKFKANKKNSTYIIISLTTIIIFIIFHIFFKINYIPKINFTSSLIHRFFLEFGNIKGVGLFSTILGIIAIFNSWNVNKFWKYIISAEVLSFVLTLIFPEAIFYFALFTAILDSNIIFNLIKDKNKTNKIILIIFISGMILSYYNYLLFI